MDIRFLTTFLEVAQTRHFGKAADNLYLTQSAVSARIKLLEEYFNTSLFIRNRNSIQLSPAGEKLMPFARTMAATLSDARKSLSEADFKHLACSATPNAFSVFVDTMLADIEQAFPDLSLRTDLSNVEQLSRQLHERSIDIAFTTEQLKSDDIESVKLHSVPLALFSQQQIDPQSDFSHYVHVDWSPKTTESLSALYPACKNARFKSTSHQVALSYLARHGGVALLPEVSARDIGFDCKLQVPFKLNLYINYIQGSNHAGLQDIVNFMTEHYAEAAE